MPTKTFYTTIFCLFTHFWAIAQTPSVPTSEKPYPTFPGGDIALAEWLASHLQYPQSAIEKGERGRVRVSFIIEYDGSVSNVTVWEGVSLAIDAEAARLVRAMPRWNLGYVDGKRVRATYSIWIEFNANNAITEKTN